MKKEEMTMFIDMMAQAGYEIIQIENVLSNEADYIRVSCIRMVVKKTEEEKGDE